MVIVKFMGGLGNQMFQYALYEKLKSMGKCVKADTVGSFEADSLRKYELDKFPNVNLVEATDEEKGNYYNHDRKWYYRIIGRLSKNWKRVKAFENMNYDESVYSVCDAYIYGFWQSEKYFLDIEDVIRESFIFPELCDKKNLGMLEQIEAENSVSIHIRRGDYLSEVNRCIYGNICTEYYYEQAIRYFEEKYSDVTFFIFSNDSEWVQKKMKAKKAVVVDGNVGEKAIFDMLLMSKCKHNIIANSSFSWWGAWLNRNQDKEVIAPSKWMNTEQVVDIWGKGWIKIDGQFPFLKEKI